MRGLLTHIVLLPLPLVAAPLAGGEEDGGQRQRDVAKWKPILQKTEPAEDHLAARDALAGGAARPPNSSPIPVGRVAVFAVSVAWRREERAGVVLGSISMPTRCCVSRAEDDMTIGVRGIVMIPKERPSVMPPGDTRNDENGYDDSGGDLWTINPGSVRRRIPAPQSLPPGRFLPVYFRSRIGVAGICLGIPVVAYLAWWVIPVSRAPSLTPEVSFDGKIESVMLLDRGLTTRYVLDQPFRVLRDGRVEMSRVEDDDAIQGRVDEPIVRLDLNVRGEHVVIFARIKH